MLRQYSAALIASILALLLVGAEPISPIRLTIINKSGMKIAVQLNSVPEYCYNKAGTGPTNFYYLPVPEGSKDLPSSRDYIIEKGTYVMRVFYIETYDPVYGFQCSQPIPNTFKVTRNQKVVIGECSALPPNGGEPSMRKYLPYPLPRDTPFVKRYWINRFIY